MRTERATVSDFLNADQVVLDANRRPVKGATVCKLTNYFRQGGQSGLDRLDQLAKFQRLIVENPKNFKELMSSYLVWYKPNKKGEAGWQYTGCKNYTVGEYVNYIRRDNIRANDKDTVEKIKELRRKLEGGLCKDIILVAAFDTELKKRVIVDGCKRVVALALIAAKNPATFSDLLGSKCKAVVMELRSRWAHSLYPCDFIPFLEECNPNIVGRSRTELRDASINALITEFLIHR